MTYMRSLLNGEIKARTTNKCVNHSIMTDNNEKTITVVKPHDFSKTREYIDVLKTGNGLIIDFSSASILDGQKILDYLCGATYALDAKIERIDNNLYLMTPKSVKIVTKM